MVVSGGDRLSRVRVVADGAVFSFTAELPTFAGGIVEEALGVIVIGGAEARDIGKRIAGGCDRGEVPAGSCSRHFSNINERYI